MKPAEAPRLRRAACRVALVLASLAPLSAAWAQFSHVPLPLARAEAPVSGAADERSYRRDAARMVYEAFPTHVFRGQLPALMHAIAITETDIDDDGRIRAVRLVREPAAAKEVGPWVVAMIRRLDRLPVPGQLRGHTWTEVWLVDRSGRFQTDSLSEGQRYGR
jgi:periplasmic protein TonB